MIGVHTGLAEYRAAAAELPESCRLTNDVAGAIVVLDGGGWPAAARQAARDGATALVIAAPRDAEALADLPVPVVLDRPGLRPDLADDARASVAAGSTPVLFTVECAAPPDAFRAAVRDAVGWLRVLSGGVLVLRSAARSQGGAIALFDAPGGVAATLIATEVAPATDARMRAVAVGESRTAVTFGMGAVRVVRASAAGELRLPTRYEDRRRTALRRAVAAVGGSPCPDVRELHSDDTLAAAVLTASDAISVDDPDHRQNRVPL